MAAVVVFTGEGMDEGGSSDIIDKPGVGEIDGEDVDLFMVNGKKE